MSTRLVDSSSRRSPKPRAYAWIAGCAGLALAVSLATARGGSEAGRDAALAQALEQRGIRVDTAAIVWLAQPPLGVIRSATDRVPVIFRARPGPEEPHDIYLAPARLSPEGVLLSVGRAHNLTETSAVDEQPPVGGDGWIVFREQALMSEEGACRVRLVDLAGAPAEARRGWTRFQRVQAALTRLQQTGRIDGVQRTSYSLEPAPKRLELSRAGQRLRIVADDKTVDIAPDDPLAVPGWLSAEALPERRPGNLVTWAVDRVRSEIGDEAMQYIKAIAFSALDVVLSGKEQIAGDNAAEDIAEDLGQESLEPVTQKVPTDPEIGFPPPPLEPWVTPALPGEGAWNAKDDPAFFHVPHGLPPAFVTTFIRSDRRRRGTSVYIALWDPRVMQLNMMAGVSEPKSATGATGPGMIPREPTVMKRVTAAMNAGFQALHGEFGMMSDGVVYLPPKPFGATVALMRDGSTGFGTWPESPAIPGDMLSYRQNMTPIVVDKKFNPYGRTWWGGTPADWEDKTHTVRTGICLTEEGFVAYFYGNDLSPEALAQAMIQARCAYGIALDMNAGHSGLEFYKVAPEAELPPLDRHIVPALEREGEVRDLEGWKFRARRLIRGMGLMNFPRYIQREGRDFFYLTLRHVLPGDPIAASGKDPIGWQVKGLPQHGFPYALARAELELSGGERVIALQIDPRMVTMRSDEAVKENGEPALVALVGTSSDEAPLSLWASPAAFAIGAEAPLPGAVRLLGGAAKAQRATAALGVRADSGMLVYVEVAGGPGEVQPIAAARLTALLDSLNCEERMVLPEPWPVALGGDTAVAGHGVRLPADARAASLWRRQGAGARRVFQDTPIVPLKYWHPLQARRIRYFKKADDS